LIAGNWHPLQLSIKLLFFMPANSQPTASQQPANSQPTASQQPANSQPTANQQPANSQLPQTNADLFVYPSI
jgi:hypothetical protein